MVRHDFVHAVRSLAARPVFTLVAVITLALGIGANTVIFSWIEATLLTPLPGARATGSLAALHVTARSRQDISLSSPNYVDLRDARLPAIADVAVFSSGALTLRVADGAERVWGAVVSGNLFDVLGVPAARGRTLTPADDVTPDGHPVAVLTHRGWQGRFGGRADVVGQTIVLNERAFTVIGVTPPAFHGPQPLIGLDVLIPMAMQTAFVPGNRLAARGNGWLQTLVRLAPGATLADAQTGLDVAAARLAARYPDTAATVTRGHETVLVVDDDRDIRAMLVRALRRAGYTVLEAGNGADALQRLGEAGGTVDLLLTDVKMPGMGGRELADAARARYPSLRVLFSSGYAENAIADHGVLADGVHFIAKPYTLQALTARIRAVLAA
jgi:CheY-like chemotaxis protein